MPRQTETVGSSQPGQVTLSQPQKHEDSGSLPCGVQGTTPDTGRRLGGVWRARNSLLRFITCYYPVKKLSDAANSMCVLRYESWNAQEGREIAFRRERGKGRQSWSPHRTLGLHASLFGCPQGIQNEEKSMFTYK